MLWAKPSTGQLLAACYFLRYESRCPQRIFIFEFIKIWDIAFISVKMQNRCIINVSVFLIFFMYPQDITTLCQTGTMYKTLRRYRYLAFVDENKR
jgi:hypothetical protein